MAKKRRHKKFTSIKSHISKPKKEVPTVFENEKLVEDFNTFSVELGSQLERWKALKLELAIVTNERMTRYLLDIHENCKCRLCDSVETEDKQCATAAVQIKEEPLDIDESTTETTQLNNFQGDSDDGDNDAFDDDISNDLLENNPPTPVGISKDVEEKSQVSLKVDSAQSNNTKNEEITCIPTLTTSVIEDILKKDTLKVKLQDIGSKSPEEQTVKALNSSVKRKDKEKQNTKRKLTEILSEENSSSKQVQMLHGHDEVILLPDDVEDEEQYERKLRQQAATSVKEVDGDYPLTVKNRKNYRTRTGRYAKRTEIYGDIVEGDAFEAPSAYKKYKKKKPADDDDEDFVCDVKIDFEPSDEDEEDNNQSSIEAKPLTECWECKAEFTTKKELTAHVKSCIKAIMNNDYTCTHCNTVYAHLSALVTHRERILKMTIDETCWKCNEHFTKKNLWREHVLECFREEKHPSRPYGFICSYCKKSCRNIIQFSMHCRELCPRFEVKELMKDEEPFIDDEKIGNLYQCPKCSKRYTTLLAFARHKAKCKYSHCEQCKKQFKSDVSYNSHVDNKICEGTRSAKYGKDIVILHHEYDRELKQIKYVPSEELTYPEPTSVKVLPFQCRFCKWYFNRSSLHEKHELKCSKGVFKYACKNCAKYFANRESILNHLENIVCFKPEHKDDAGKSKPRLELVNPEEQAICDVCGLVCMNRNRLMTHKFSHMRKKCPICSKMMSAKFYKKHIERHQGTRTKTFACQFCGKLFWKEDSMLEHEVTHSGIGKYKCNYCDKQFHMRHVLSKHMRMHTGEKPYGCRYCESHFATFYSRIAHEVSIHTKKWRHFCPHCEKGFVAKNAMQDHAAKCQANPNRDHDIAILAQTPKVHKPRVKRNRVQTFTNVQSQDGREYHGENFEIHLTDPLNNKNDHNEADSDIKPDDNEFDQAMWNGLAEASKVDSMQSATSQSNSNGAVQPRMDHGNLEAIQQNQRVSAFGPMSLPHHELAQITTPVTAHQNSMMRPNQFLPGQMPPPLIPIMPPHQGAVPHPGLFNPNFLQ